PADPSSLPSSFVWDVEEDARGDLWIATANGLAKWERAKDRIVPQENVGGRNIRALRFASSGEALWIGTRDSGLLRLDGAPGQLQPFARDPSTQRSLADDRVYAIYLDGAGRLWVGTDGGLDLLQADGRSFIHYAADTTDPASLSDDKVRALQGDSAGAIWV